MNTLQKTFVSLAAVFAFGFYAFMVREQDTQLVAIRPSTETADNTQQSSATDSNPPSSAAFQAYVDQINAAAATDQVAQAQAQQQTAAKAQADAQAAQQQAEAKTQAQQQAVQLTAQQQAAARAQAAQQAAQLAAQQQAVRTAQAAAEAAAQLNGQYKNGTYTGPSVNVFYGYVQVLAVIQNGQLADVRFLQYPNDRSTSRYINSQAMPFLKQEAIQAQSANVDGVSGASATSQGFVQSLGSALSQART